MRLSDFDFELPDELIAQQPAARRDESRMMLVDRVSGKIFDRMFTDLPALLHPTDVLVVNNTKVFPARLIGTSSTGAKIELFLISEARDGTWTALSRPARRLSAGKVITFADDLAAEVMEKMDDGRVSVRFDRTRDLYEIFDSVGRTPLPPYIKRAGSQENDRERYQTVYARNRGAIAAPTAGLHFTPKVLDSIRDRGIPVVEITLHVGYGTFEPVRTDDLSQHSVSAERYELSPEAASALENARRSGSRLVAVGTTTTRALESSIGESCGFSSGSRLATLTITPGYRFRAVGALLTNFHLPKSSLLVLTSSFGGHDLIMRAYRHAVDERYRFYSYGDCMLIV